MAKNTMNDLRDHLFVALERLNDDDIMKDSEKRELEIERSKAIVDISNSLIASAKVEVDFLKVTDKFQTSSSMFKQIGSGE